VLSAAGVAFYAFLAMIPAFAALLAVYGLVADPEQAASRVEELLSTAPEEARSLLGDQLRTLAERSGGALSLTLVAAVALSLWSASAGVAHLMEAIGVVYDERDERSFVVRRGVALGLTLAGVVGTAVALGLVAVLPQVVEDAGAEVLVWPARVLGWAVVAVGFVVSLSVLFRVSAHRRDPEWRWVTPGSVLALVAWLVATVAFSVYASRFGSFDETYGSLGAVIVVLLWLDLTALVVLFAAEVNAELEHQTARDTTTGEDRPPGSRDAEMADRVAR
jgi:membrane protein